MIKNYLLPILLIASIAASAAGMNIKITVRGLENSNMILANYYGDKQYVKDTLVFDKKGMLTIKADTMLPGGIYLAVFPLLGNRYFEFVVSEPSFSLETDTTDLSGHMRVTGSEENRLFYDDMRYLGVQRIASDSLSKLYKTAKDGSEKENLRNQLIRIDSLVKAHRTNVMEKYPTLFYGKLLKMMQDIQVPDAPRDATGKITDSTFQWRYYKSHYWDNVDMKDERVLRCPVYHNKLKTFMNQTIVQHPDSVNAAGDELLSKTDMKGELYRYTLSYIFNEMANSKVMGMDASYVHFGKNYFCKGLTPWVDTAKQFKICDRVNRLEPVLVGKKAQRLILPVDSTEKQWKNLYDVKAKWTILAFWDPDCGHCKKEIPVLADAYHNLKKMGIDVEVFSPAIMEIENYKDWIEFIQKNKLDWINVCDPHRHSNFRWEWDIQSTPQVYILDKDKVIRARRIGAEQIEDYVRYLEDPSYKPKSLMKVSDNDKQEGTD